MAVARTHTVALRGIVGHLVDVEADVSAGVVGTTLVGRVDSILAEGKMRCRMAISNSGLEWPATRRVTISLSPADLPKSGAHFDLAMAISVLASTHQLPPDSLNDTAFFAELTLPGGLRSVSGVLPMTLAARDRGVRRVFVPEPQAAEAALVPGVAVFGMRSLLQVVAELRGVEVPEAPPVAQPSAAALVTWQGQHRTDEMDMRDLVGITDAKYALEVAAAGGHHLLISGPRGAGKTSLAERLPGLLPDLTEAESLELTAIHSLAGSLTPGEALQSRPPFFAPHHGASAASLLGGGTGRVRPGELSRAHCGVLFLDEFPLFHRDLIESLRQPLESGEVTIARGEEAATFPARALVVLAANPCPCGDYHPDQRQNQCRCSEVKRREYRRKIDGPIADRIDIVRHLTKLSYLIDDPLAPPESSAQIRERITAARQRQHTRYRDHWWRLNGQVPGAALTKYWPLPPEAGELIEEGIRTSGLSRRGATRAHRLALTIADLGDRSGPAIEQVEQALRLRLGKPLLSMVAR